MADVDVDCEMQKSIWIYLLLGSIDYVKSLDKISVFPILTKAP
jgi:hypothetical protein